MFGHEIWGPSIGLGDDGSVRGNERLIRLSLVCNNGSIDALMQPAKRPLPPLRLQRTSFVAVAKNALDATPLQKRQSHSDEPCQQSPPTLDSHAEPDSRHFAPEYLAGPFPGVTLDSEDFPTLQRLYDLGRKRVPLPVGRNPPGDNADLLARLQLELDQMRTLHILQTEQIQELEEALENERALTVKLEQRSIVLLRENESLRRGAQSDSLALNNILDRDSQTLSQTLSQESLDLETNFPYNWEDVCCRLAELSEDATAHFRALPAQSPTNARKVRFEPCPNIRLEFFSNVFILDNTTPRSYRSKEGHAFMRDILDGYFPLELKARYPEGVRFELVDSHARQIDQTNDRDNARFPGRGRTLAPELWSPVKSIGLDAATHLREANQAFLRRCARPMEAPRLNDEHSK